MNAVLRRASVCPNCKMPTRSYHSWDGRGHAWYYCSAPWCGKRTIGPSPLAPKPDKASAAHRKLARAVKDAGAATLRYTPEAVEAGLVAALRRLRLVIERTGATILTRRDVQQAAQMPSATLFGLVLDRLIEDGYLEFVDLPRRPGSRGRAPTHYRVHLAVGVK